MARPIRKKLQFGNEESLNGFLQEIYNESHNIRAQVITLFNQWNSKAKENGEIAVIGDKIAKLLALLSKNQDQKIMLLKHLKDSIYIDKKGDSKDIEQNKSEISTNEKDDLDAFVEKIKKQQKTN